MATPSIGPNRQANNTGYKVLYENIRVFPEVGHFRRFAALWAKLIHDDTREVLYRREIACEKLCEANSLLHGVDVLDIPRHEVKEKYGDICEETWMAYEEALRQHGRDLCMSSQIMQLPEQAAYATAYLKQFEKPVFIDTDKLRFGLTQEDAQEYVGPRERRDACAWKVPQSGLIAEKISEWAPGFRKMISRLLCRGGEKRVVGRNEPPSEENAERTLPMMPPFIAYPAMVRVIDVLTCIFICMLLMSVMFVLESIPRLKTRIGTTGALGTVFSVLVMLLAGPSRRIEVYAATIAFFAIACEYLSNVGSGSSGH